MFWNSVNPPPRKDGEQLPVALFTSCNFSFCMLPYFNKSKSHLIYYKHSSILTLLYPEDSKEKQKSSQMFPLF
jgi:hypothetical protein